MKKLLGLCACLACLTATAQQDTETELAMKAGINSSLLVCKLTGPEFQKRKTALQKEVFSQTKMMEELPDGYLFYFDDKGDFAEKLADYALAEKKCCPFFQIDFQIKPNSEGLALKLTGPEGVKEMIGEILEVESRK